MKSKAEEKKKGMKEKQTKTTCVNLYYNNNVKRRKEAVKSKSINK